jgi:hypothetical protein
MEEKSKYSKSIITLILVIIVILLLKDCVNGCKNDFKPILDTLTIHKSDTIRDTLTVFKTKEKVVFKYIDVEKDIDTSKYSEIRKFRVYKDTIRDSNIVIFNNDTILGYLTSRHLSYKLLVPLKIYDSTTTIITKEYPKLPKNQINVGADVFSKGVYISASFSVKRNTYGLSYDLTNKNILLSYKYTLWYGR